MKELQDHLTQCLVDAVDAVYKIEVSGDVFSFSIPDNAQNGDMATSGAMRLARDLKRAPQQIATDIVNYLASCNRLPEVISRVEVAGTGYLNFFFKESFYTDLVKEIICQDHAYGSANVGQGKKILLEFVSANPTGPLNAVSARAAAVGDTLCNILTCAGYDAQREYYVNDCGRQADLFGRSVEARMMQKEDPTYSFPEDGYAGEWVSTVAQQLQEELSREKGRLSEAERSRYIRDRSIEIMVESHKNDIARYGVQFDRWFSEKTLHEGKHLEASLSRLEEIAAIKREDNKVFFKAEQWGDSEDRVVVRDNGIPTYFMADIAYHLDKVSRGYDQVIDLWGPDHHGYIPRVRAVFRALGMPEEVFKVIIVQQVNLLRDGVKVKMGKRAGNIVTMKEIVDEVGKDAARYFFLTRSISSHLDFDMEVAKKQDDANPVYTIQYAHARIYGIFRKALTMPDYSPLFSSGGVPNMTEDLSGLNQKELELIRELFRYKDCIRRAALHLEPQHIANYVLSLARALNSYHTYGTKNPEHRVLSDDKGLTHKRLTLINAVRIVLRNALTVMGVHAPMRMENL